MIPNKSSFKFQELPSITGVKPYVIRFWESEFEEISPVDSDSGQKIYSRKDVETILRIKKLLFEDKLTVREAKTKLVDIPLQELPVTIPNHVPSADYSEVRESLKSALNFIQEIKKNRGWQ